MRPKLTYEQELEILAIEKTRMMEAKKFHEGIRTQVQAEINRLSATVTEIEEREKQIYAELSARESKL